jgi:DNA polymerase III subunit gamma/tau
MSYIVLARKYRSQTFDEVVGQEAIARTLKNAITTGKVAHAYLFTGTRGVGKTTMARILAKALNCLSSNTPTTEPCCKCDSCTAVNIGEDIDVIEIDGASNRGIDSIRELIQNATYRPARSRFKIYIIDEVHMFTNEAFNALLKILEEPPSHIKFIFATTEPQKVIATVQSRCQRFDFANIGPRTIAKQLEYILQKENIEYEKDLVVLLAKMANGSMRDSLSLLDRLISTGQPLTVKLLEENLGCSDSEKLWCLISTIGNSDAAGTLDSVDALITAGFSEVRIVDLLIDYLRDLMLVKTVGSKSEILILTARQRQQADDAAQNFDIAALVYLITALEKIRWPIKNSESARPLLEATLLRFALSEHFLNVDKLVAQLNKSADTGVKKNKIADPIAPSRPEPPAKIPHVAPSEPQDSKSQPLHLNDLASLQKNWHQLLNCVSEKLGNGTMGLLTRALPTKLDAGCLTITFDSNAQVQFDFCKTNGRPEKIESCLAERLGRNIKLNFELGVSVLTTAGLAAAQNGSIRQRENDVVSEPAVKTIITELGATITNIENFDN